MQLRVARHTTRLDELVRFYRDGLGLREAGRFDAHEGYDGVFLAVPGTNAHLEFTSGGQHAPPEPNPESLLVLYLGNDEAVPRRVSESGPTRWSRQTHTGAGTVSLSPILMASRSSSFHEAGRGPRRDLRCDCRAGFKRLTAGQAISFGARSS